jgi:MoaA/NifB/PqqE/SkfB family radical SAM enzyme
MCSTWKYPSRRSEEFSQELIKKIPVDLRFVNITGGEPCLRNDLEKIIEIALKKTKRLVISTNGYFTDKLTQLADIFGNRIGFRISIEGLPATNDELRGLHDGFDHGLRSLVTLIDKGIKDVGFGITVSDRNAKDLIELYRLSKLLDLEFATAVTHNSFYFHKLDNVFEQPDLIVESFEKIALDLLKSKKPKNWFRAYFNMGLANKVRNGKRPLPCEAGMDLFFLDPFGNILPCNGSEQAMIMGNLNENTFNEIWYSDKANRIRDEVKQCRKECWMIGSASPAMKKRVWKPVFWIIHNKTRLLLTKNKSTYLDPIISCK